MKRTVRALMAGSLLMLLAPVPVLAKSWKKELVQKIEELYKPTEISLWDGELKGGMTIMVVTQGGAMAWLATDMGYPLTGVQNGKVMVDPAESTHSMARVFKKGEKVLIFDVKIVEDVDYVKDTDVIRVSLLSVDAAQHQVGGNTVSTRYRGGFDYWFPRDHLKTADFAEIKKALNSTLVSEAEFQAIDSPATVRLGMTPEQVEQALGKPQKVIDLGAKKIYVYSDIKITFADGKVADVQ